MKGIVLTSAAGLANACCRRFDAQFGFIKSVQLRRTVITVILLGIAAIGASFGMKALLQHCASSSESQKQKKYCSFSIARAVLTSINRITTAPSVLREQ